VRLSRDAALELIPNEVNLMKAVSVTFQAGMALVLAILAVYRLANPIPAGERLIARATIEQISSSVIIPRGMRAVAVPVNEVVGVAEFTVAGK
jgi:Flp pilus assembly protein CpaB